MTGPFAHLTHHNILLQYDHEYVWAWTLMTNGKQINKDNTPSEFSKYKNMKNLARTLSLFLIFSEICYKSKTWIYVTELCYEIWFTTQTNDKVLIKQTKNQSTYSFAGQKLTVNSEYIAY